jgi:intracellular sulfur oxidation DsrE/DsrF family protein
MHKGMTRAELLALGAAAMVPVATTTVASAAAPSAFHFDEARFNDILARPARHRQCCASAKVAGGSVLDSMVSTMYAYEVTLGEGPGTVHEVAVLYHPAGVILGLNDALWNEMVLPALARLSSYFRTDLTLHGAPKAGGGNPYLHRDRSAALLDDTAIETLVSRGCHFFVCNNALLGLADSLATALGERSEVVYARLLGGLVPGAMAVPAGVMAINACQEAHFTYLQATL